MPGVAARAARESASLLLLAVVAPAAAFAGAPTLRAIAPGVEARIGVDEAGIRSVEEVRIAPARKPGEPPPELGPPLVAAWDWCAGNVENGFETSYKGIDTRHGCRIRVDAGVYRIRETAILRERRPQQVPIEIDLQGASIVHMPDAPKAIRVRELAALPCNATTQGDYYQVVDPEDFDALDRSDPEGPVEIARIGPNASRTAGCPSGGTVCKFGAQAIRVDTHTPHGLDDGGLEGLGDVVELSAPGTEYDAQRLLVKEVVSPTAFLGTLDRPASAVVTHGSVRETATTAWCNGASWRAGKPMIAIGGPGSTTKLRTTLRGGTFAFDATLYRTTAVLVDGEMDPGGAGGAEWVTLSGVGHTGNSSLRGQILVALGTPRFDHGLCNGIDVDVDSDFLGGSWSPAVWNQSCNNTSVKIQQHHGGGVWWGLDAPAFAGPAAGRLQGYVEGCRDGPALWVRSGQLVLAEGFKVWGSNWGPHGSPAGANAGRLAILGSPKGIAVNVVAHGVTWGAGQDSDLDCYVTLANVSHLVQLGGYMLSGNAKIGDGAEYLFCTPRGGHAEDVVIEHVEQHAWDGGEPHILRSGVH